MPVIEITPEQLGVAFPRLLRARRDIIVREARRIAATTVRFAREITERENIVYLGNYATSWAATEIRDGARVDNDAPYARYIEYGRRPGATPPPRSAILPWVHIKLGLRGPEARQAARNIARAIGRRGLPPKRVLFRAWVRALPLFRRNLAIQFARAARPTLGPIPTPRRRTLPERLLNVARVLFGGRPR